MVGWVFVVGGCRRWLPSLGDDEIALLRDYIRDHFEEIIQAEKDIKAPDGSLLEKAGAVRDGGSYEDRMGAVACWNAVMDENDYMVRKWNEFIAA